MKSMNKPTQEQIAKIPKWAQEALKDYERRTVVAERALKEYLDNQTEAPFFIDDLLCVGEGSPQSVRKYIQTHSMTVQRDGVELNILLRQEDPGIDLSWSTCGPERLVREVPMIARGFNQVRLVPKDKLR